MNYNHLHYFWVVLQEKSFIRAAEKLYVSQSAISEQIKTLEDNFGFKLFNRYKRQELSLTEEGSVVAQYAETIFKNGQELQEWSKNQSLKSTKKLSIGALAGLSRNFQYEFLSPLIHEEASQFEVISGDSDKLLSLVDQFKIDMILSFKKLELSSDTPLALHLLTSSPVVIACSSEEKISSSKNLKNFFEENELLLPSYSSEIRPEVDSLFEKLNIKPTIKAEVDDTSLLRLLTVKGGGISIIPKMGIINELKEGTIKILHTFQNLKESYYAITRQKKFSNPLVTKIINSYQKKKN